MTETRQDVPQEGQLIPVANGAEAFVQLLVAQRVEVIFLNPGTDTAPIQEAVVAMRARGVVVPRIQLCPDERIAMAAAQSWWQRTGRVQLVVVHVDVGTLALGASAHNAQRTNSGVVVVAGTAPRTFDDELPGGRTISVHWQQDQVDQLGILRGFTKWSQDIAMLETMSTLVPRAFRIAASAPAGPVYLTVAREVLMRTTETVRIIPPERQAVPALPAAPASELARVAEWLMTANQPLLVTSRLGRRPEAVDLLDRLARRVGLAVIDAREYLNLPSSHPCYVEQDAAAAEHLKNADLVMLVDVEVPWVPSNRRPPPTARVVQVDLDPVKSTVGNWAFPVDLSLQACSMLTLAQILNVIDGQATEVHEQRWRDRLAALHAAKDERATCRLTVVSKALSRRPVSPIALVHALDEVVSDDALVFEEVTTNDLVVREHLTRERPDSIIAIGAAGLGWAPGAAFGAKLESPDREVIALVGDGSFIFSAPLAWLWAARNAGTAFLTVVFNNAGYRAAKLPVMGLFPEGASIAADDFAGTVLTDPPRFAGVAEACGAFGAYVDDPADLVGALSDAAEAVRAGHCAVVDVRLDDI